MLRQAAGRRVLSYPQIFAFWFPLGLMWLMMALEQPAVAAAIARMPDAALNLAAFGVVFSIALVAESPIIQMLSAATALSGHRQNYELLLRFTNILAAILTAGHLLIALTPLYELIVAGLLNVPVHIMETSRLPFLIMAPFSAAVGYRRLWQGVLIRHGKTWIVPVSMVSRLVVLAIVLGLGLTRWQISGALVASIAIATGASTAAIVAGLLNRTFVTPTLRDAGKTDTVLGWHGLLQFYVPLSLTTVVYLLAQPALTFGIARALMPERSLAVWPVLTGFLFIFNSFALSHQETSIALLTDHPANVGRLRRFTAGLAITLSGLMLLSGLTPAGTWWFRGVSGLSDELLALTGAPLLILAVAPAIVTYKAWFRARYVSSGRTRVLAEGVVIYTVVLFALVFVGSTLPLAGVTAAAGAMVLALSAEIAYLIARRPGLPPARRQPAPRRPDHNELPDDTDAGARIAERRRA